MIQEDHKPRFCGEPVIHSGKCELHAAEQKKDISEIREAQAADEKITMTEKNVIAFPGTEGAGDAKLRTAAVRAIKAAWRARHLKVTAERLKQAMVEFKGDHGGSPPGRAVAGSVGIATLHQSSPGRRLAYRGPAKTIDARSVRPRPPVQSPCLTRLPGSNRPLRYWRSTVSAISAEFIRNSSALFAEISWRRECAGSFGARHQLAIKLRNGFLRDAARLFADLPLGERAKRLSAALARYRSTSWLRDRDKSVCPYTPGTEAAALWHALRVLDADLSQRQVERIIDSDTKSI